MANFVEYDKDYLREILSDFELNKHNHSFKKGIYVYGEPGTGKTTFVVDILKQMNYDVVRYDAGDIRNKAIIDTITKHNMSDKNIMSMFYKKIKRIAIIMDEIDGMNNGDKGGINSLIKIIRPKKTKKQRLEEITLNPINTLYTIYDISGYRVGPDYTMRSSESDINNNIPIPIRSKRKVLPYEELEVGDSFLYKDSTLPTVCNTNYRYSKKLNRKFIAKKDGNHVRVWRTE